MAHVTIPNESAVTNRLLYEQGGVLWKYATKLSADVTREIVSNLNNGSGFAGVRVRTGRLKASPEERIVLNGRHIRLTWGTRVKYAKFVHQGRKAIHARPGSALKFTLPNGTVVIRKSVGPSPARPFITEAVRTVIARRR